MGARVVVDELRKAFPANGSGRGEKLVLDSVSFEIADGEFVAFLGPSGCGKTTLVNVLAGFTPPDRGRVLFDGVAVNGPSPERVVVSQDYALFEWKTALDNVAFGLKASGMRRRERRELAQRYLERVELGNAPGLYPHELSGGMQQRLAVARALAVDPKCLLLDEPFAALDYQLRLHLQAELSGLWHETGQTIVLVTHDIEEAVYLADRIILLTPCPARAAQTIPVDLPRPRTPELRASAGFQELRLRAWTTLEAQHPR